MTEYIISICGRKQSEWNNLVSWFVNYSCIGLNLVDEESKPDPTIAQWRNIKSLASTRRGSRGSI
ncbi:hypothetical protein Hdeb2414_s0029g00707041 [Helianthus debilis subsp. tardiflorus]